MILFHRDPPDVVAWLWNQVNPLAVVLLAIIVALVFFLGLSQAILLLPVYHCI